MSPPSSSASSVSSISPRIPCDLFPVPEDSFQGEQFNPQAQLKHKKSFVTKVFSKRHGTNSAKRRKDDFLDDEASERESIRTTTSNGGASSFRSIMFRKHRSNTSTSTTSTLSESGSIYSNMSMGSSSSECDKYGLPKSQWVPQYF